MNRLARVMYTHTHTHTHTHSAGRERWLFARAVPGMKLEEDVGIRMARCSESCRVLKR